MPWGTGGLPGDRDSRRAPSSSTRPVSPAAVAPHPPGRKPTGNLLSPSKPSCLPLPDGISPIKAAEPTVLATPSAPPLPGDSTPAPKPPPPTPPPRGLGRGLGGAGNRTGTVCNAQSTIGVGVGVG
ncbi:unnamed protein product, partial [Discosporangium mesarthrocarpum]